MAIEGAKEAFQVFGLGTLVAGVATVGLGIPAVCTAAGAGSFILALFTGAAAAVTLICGVITLIAIHEC